MKTLKFVVLLLLIFSISSCKKQIDTPLKENVNNTFSEDLKTAQGRFVFTSAKAFVNTLDLLSKKSVHEARAFILKYNIATLEALNSRQGNDQSSDFIRNESDFSLPYIYSLLLNESGEVQIGNEVIVYKDGVKYYFPVEEYHAGLSLASAKKKKDIEIKSISKKNSTNNSRISFSDNGLDARWQREFYQQSYQNNGTRKFVHEIVSFTDYYDFYDPVTGLSGYTFYTQLFLRIKLEWKGRRNWNPAGEYRDISYNLTKDIYLRNVVFPYTSQYAFIPFTGNISDFRTQNSDLQVQLGGFSGNTVNGGVYWEVDLRGNIYQYVLGDLVLNSWNNIGSPLW